MVEGFLFVRDIYWYERKQNKIKRITITGYGRTL